jgi:hypothetical protein
MSSIAKIAVYDARLMQEPPAYAVQKGALSVSVAPFNAISANQSSMVFQVLVPSLNVFVDRQIQLRTTLNFTANLFYSGPRSLTSSAVVAYNGTFVCSDYTFTLNSGTGLNLCDIGSKVFISGLLPGGLPALSTIPFSVSATVTDVAAEVYTIDVLLPSIAADPPGTSFNVVFLDPANFDTPDPAMGVRYDLSNNQYASGVSSTSAFLPLGYASAVSSKDLAYCLFPVQSCLSNMTATLNDCTVSTNGDTLHEQLLLTGTRDNVKQRTTPSKYDTFAWGDDDANNGSGNFSSYSVVDTTGDLPNGSFPTVWYADASGGVPLTSINNIQAGNPSGQRTTGATAAYPFLPPPTAASFDSNKPDSSPDGTGAGWYIAAPSIIGVQGQSPTGVVVPFVDGQPVWTTAFPGGDLHAAGNVDLLPFQFDIIQTGGIEVLQLLTEVPPYCMIGARLYLASSVASGAPITALGFVSGLATGSMGKLSSTYTFVTGAVDGLFGIRTTLALQAGFQATTSAMPVFGAVATVEPLVISPLIFADSAQFQTVGLYGMTNMQFVLNFTSKLGSAKALSNGVGSGTGDDRSIPYWVDDLSQNNTNTGNILRSSGIRTTISDLSYSTVASSINGPWVNPALYVTFLTPGPDVTLPLVSTVPYAEFPRYILNQNVTAGAIGATTLATNTISLTSIPDMIMLYVKPATKGPSQLDTYIPIKNVSISFDNFSNLCSGFQQFNLYECSVAAGLDMDWSQFRGYAAGAVNSYSRVQPQSSAGPIKYKPQAVTQLSGAPLVLRMGHDITLSPGLAPGCLGNYSIQANITVDNSFKFFDYVTSCTVTLIAINTGFFETVRGQSAIRKTVLNSADVEAAIPESGMSRTALTRMIGRGGMRDMGSATGPTIAHGVRSLLTRGNGGGGGGGGGGGHYGGDGGKRMRSGIM